MKHDTKDIPCGKCAGTGHTRQHTLHATTSVPCDACAGKGTFRVVVPGEEATPHPSDHATETPEPPPAVQSSAVQEAAQQGFSTIHTDSGRQPPEKKRAK